MTSRRIALVALHCSIAAACHGGGAATCTSDDQCASHFCKLDGTCGPAAIDAPPGQVDAPGDAASGLCTPNHDGQITLAELPLAAGRSATFRIATNATWSTAGHANADGSRTWDLTGMLAGDADQTLALASPAGAWWQASYPAATYATALSASSNLLGVFEVDANGLTLVGVVSPSGGATSTALTYDPPVRVVTTPFITGTAWTSTSTVSGTAQGLAVAYTEQYDSRVDQVGTLAAPYGTFPVLRIATDMTRTAGLATLTTNRTFTWAAECFGFVATATSQNFETQPEFSNDAEVSRLAP
jgi:hypothetical protein